MRIALFSAKPFDREFFDRANARHGHEIVYFEPGLDATTAGLATGFPCVCPFVNDRLDKPTVDALAAGGTRLLALRSAGFNHVDLAAAAERGITVARVPAYSPHAVAEHAVGLLLTVNRKLHRAAARVREHNFALDGLMGFDLHAKTVGLVGTGRIGEAFARIMIGFGCTVLASDPKPDDELASLGVQYVALDELLERSDVVSLHCPLTPETHHLISDDALARMKPGVVILNTSRGAVLDTRAVIRALKAGRLGGLGIDVYEEEGDLFFRDLSDRALQDDVLARLLTFPNVVVTAHQGFFTREAMDAIAETTLANATGFARGSVPAANLVTPQAHVAKSG
ncbi:MAG TPA: 2-hydroxyacid dehydrogenase [Phycisphaerales bacterium]|nr:2-hydroxyacid dehydrogenase [Phycisphaerales bacterium]